MKTEWMKVVETSLAAETQYPVDFAVIWPIAGYTRKSDAKRSLLQYLVKDEDYEVGVLRRTPQNPTGKGFQDLGGRPEEKIMLTVDAAKELCMLSKTAQGREVRRYYIECEKALKKVMKLYHQVCNYMGELHALMSEDFSDVSMHANQIRYAWRDYVESAASYGTYDEELGDVVYKALNDLDDLLIEGNERGIMTKASDVIKDIERSITPSVRYKKGCTPIVSSFKKPVAPAPISFIEEYETPSDYEEEVF